MHGESPRLATAICINLFMWLGLIVMIRSSKRGFWTRLGCLNIFVMSYLYTQAHMAALYDPTTSINFSYFLCLDALFSTIATVLTDGVTFSGLLFWTTVPKLFLGVSLGIVYPERLIELVGALIGTTVFSVVNAASVTRAFEESDKFTFVDQFITIYLDLSKMVAGLTSRKEKT